MNKPSTATVLMLFALVTTLIVVGLVARRFSHEAARTTRAHVAAPLPSMPPTAAPTPFTKPVLTSLPPRAHPPDPAVSAAKARQFDSFKLHPFEAAKTSGTNAWTTEDGRAPEVVRQLAHNEWEAERMTQENPTIKRRQLVYRNETIAVTLDRARNAGTPVSSITLPALDGQEYEVEVVQNNVQREKTMGSLAGRIKDRPNSMASIGFVNGYESFNLISPDDGLYIVADSREPGEVMVKEIDPGKYALPPSGNAPDYIAGK